ncbi:hypothetical protein [Amycolatopsis plumensis]|uniref:Secreted protein n=1 Tax=Amycolatopsis plumensis TaxID=236508 RepID=A0ABV5U5X2_9PSEU
MKSRIGVLLGCVVASLIMMISGAGVAGAAVNRSDFVTQVRAAGLSTEKAAALQAKVDGYLVALKGRGKQVSPNQIDLNGAVLSVTVPGEGKARQFVAAGIPQCAGASANYGWFCAYQFENYTGDNIGMYSCGYYRIPWISIGSFQNRQTAGTVPTVYFDDGTRQNLAPAPSKQSGDVLWFEINTVRNC